MKSCPFCAEEIQDQARVCRWCGRELPDSWAAPANQPNGEIFYVGARYGFGRSRQPAATCLWDLKRPSDPPIKTWTANEQGWQEGWKAFAKKETVWIDTRNPPRCQACNSFSVIILPKVDQAFGRHFECQSCKRSWR